MNEISIANFYFFFAIEKVKHFKFEFPPPVIFKRKSFNNVSRDLVL